MTYKYKYKKFKKKAYVVFVGHKTGIFKTYAEVQPLVDGFPDAKHQGYRTMEEAEQAFADYQ